MLRLSAVVLVLVSACDNCSLPSGPRRYDAGTLPDVDAAVVADLTSRFVSVADRQATQRCLCAGDVPLCRRMVDGDWDAGGIACLGMVVRTDVAGFEAATSCLEGAVATLEFCQSTLTCADVDPRTACVDSYVSSASTCVQKMSGSAQVALAACAPLTPDAGP